MYGKAKCVLERSFAALLSTTHLRQFHRSIAFLTRRRKDVEAHPGDAIRNKLIRAMPNLQHLADETARVGHCETPLPLRMKRIAMVIETGSHPPASLPIKYLETLSVEPPAIGGEESESFAKQMNFLLWPSKIRSLTANLVKLDELYLSAPAMSTCGCTHSEERPPIEECLYDLLGSALPSLKVLHYSVPWRSSIPGDLRWTHWVSLALCLRFETLKITMHWDLSYLRGPNPSFVEVMRSLGIEVDGDTGATEFFAWIKLLFQKVAALQEVQLTFTYTLPLSSNRPRSPIRTLTFERPACPATQPSFRHEVHEDILTLVKLVMGILHHGYYTPRLPHLPHASADHLV
jgi:hypothetical protein